MIDNKSITDPHTKLIGRMQKKIDSRNRKIEGMARKIDTLEATLAWRNIDLESISRNLKQEVENALCNVRMIPVGGMSKTSKILEIRTVDE